MTSLRSSIRRVPPGWEQGFIMDELERYEQAEARDLIRLLEASRPPGDRRAPPDFGLKVLSRIEAKRARSGFFSQLAEAWRSTGRPAWAPAAMAALFVLSLGVNVWLGVERALPPLAPAATAQRPMRAHAFQQGLRDDADLGALIAAQQTASEPTLYAFSSHTSRATVFRLGAWYAEALAFLRSGDLEAAMQRWQAMDRTLGQTAEPLLSYRRQIQQALQHEPLAVAQFQTWLPLFEPFYEVEAARGHDQMLTMFQAGAWMTNMRLAAMAGDLEGLRRDPAMAYFISHLHAPKGVERGLERLRDLLAKRALSARELKDGGSARTTHARAFRVGRRTRLRVDQWTPLASGWAGAARWENRSCDRSYERSGMAGYGVASR